MTTVELCKKLRADVGLSQKELATAMGVSLNVVRLAEGGKMYGRRRTAMSKKTAKKYKEYFGVDALKDAEDKINEELSEKGITDPTTEDAREIIGKHIGYDYTVDKFGSAKIIGVSEENLERMREEEDRNYIHELEKEIEELKASLDSEKAHADFYEKQFREAEAALNRKIEENTSVWRQNEKLLGDYREAVSAHDALLVERDQLYDEVAELERKCTTLSQKDSEHYILFDLLIRFYKDHTDKPN